MPEDLLEIAEKAADVEPVADGVVDLDGQRQQAGVLPMEKPPHGKDGQQMAMAQGKMELEALEGNPGQHGDREGVARYGLPSKPSACP